MSESEDIKNLQPVDDDGNVLESRVSFSVKAFHQDPRKIAANFLALVSAIFALIVPTAYLLPETQQLPIFLALLTAYCFLVKPTKAGSKLGDALDYILAVLALVFGAYIVINANALLERAGMPTPTDIVFGIAATILLVEATRRAAGWPLTIIAVVFLGYAIAGPYLPSFMHHRGYDAERLSSQLYLTQQGMYGLPLKIMLRYVVLFVVFGNILEASGGAQFLINLAKAVAGRFTGGLGKTAMVASGLLGMLSGSAVANVVTVGTLTIPAMKKGGYKPTMAAAIEAVASTGGQIMPPVMGAAAFLMADFLQIPYSAVAFAAIVPAIMYYLSGFAAVHFYAASEGIRGETSKDLPTLRSVVKNQGHFALPLIVITVALASGVSPSMSGVYGLIAAIVVSFFKKESRLNLNQFLTAMVNAGKSSAMLSVASAAAGIVVGVVTLTGLGSKLSTMLVDASGGSLLLLLFLSMIVNIIMGMGLPTSVVYILLATLVAPAMINLGVDPLIAHMFIFFYGSISMITPPVAMAAYAAAAVADTPVWTTGWTAFKIALPIFLVPYFMVYNPSLILQGSIGLIAWTIVTTAFGCIIFAAGSMGYFLRKTNWVERTLLMIAGMGVIIPETISTIVGIIIAVIIFARQMSANRLEKAAVQG